MKPETAVGLDLGNCWTKICVSWPGCTDGLVAKMPSRYAFSCPPGALNSAGHLSKAQAFSLLFSQKDSKGQPKNQRLWFGQDTLAIPSFQKLDTLKYDANHISILLRAALYQWEQTHKGRHKVDLAELGALNVVASIPPGLYKQEKTFKAATSAYKLAINGKSPQSHPKIRDGKQTIQIVMRFGGLQQEAVAWSGSIAQQGEWSLIVDLGGGTDDYILYNGSDSPRQTKTAPTGLLNVYQSINPVDPSAAELGILRNKDSMPVELLTYYNECERRVQMFTRMLPVEISKLYFIGGGAALMPKRVQDSMKQLAPKVFFKDEYANCRANWTAARGEQEND